MWAKLLDNALADVSLSIDYVEHILIKTIIFIIQARLAF